MKLLQVEFVDPTSHQSWTDSPELREPLTCHAVGYAAHQDKRKLVLAQVIDDQGLWACTYSIPTECIKNVIELEECLTL